MLLKTDILTDLVGAIFVVSFVVQIIYCFIYLKVLFVKEKRNGRKNGFKVSVIISARNEEKNLKENLPEILNQEYSDYEVVVTDDNSEDKTYDILKEFKTKYKNLKILKADKNPGGSGNKKKALIKAISASSGDILIFTDADCVPASGKFIEKTVSAYGENTEIVTGYGAYEKRKGFLNKLIRYETLFNAMQSGGFALAGFPFAAVGRNLSYKKSLFFKNKGFSSHIDIPYGDDDLFVNEAATSENTVVLLSRESKTVSKCDFSFKQYLKRKKRHLSAGFRYKPVNKAILGTEILSRFLFYAGFLFFLLSGNKLLLAFTLLAVRFVILIIITKLFANKVDDKNNLFFIPIFDILIPVINLYSVLTKLFNGKIIWK